MRQGTGPGPDEAVVFEEWRGRLFGVAYRMLGTASEAEDAVQETYLRWRGTDRAAVVSPGAWLTKVVTNLCLNQLGSARARRERYVGQWLPEPVLTRVGTPGAPLSDSPADPQEVAEQRAAVSLALLLLLERLTPPERAVFVLREAFGYAHREVAEVLGVSEPHSRQLYRRAKRTVSGAGHVADQPLTRAPGDLLTRFLAAARDGDLAGLERLLADDVVSYADGGDQVGVARHPVVGREKVARYLSGGMRRFAAAFDLTPAVVNGAPALLGFADGQLFGVLAMEVSDGRISALHAMANPDKLEYLRQQLVSVSHPGRLSGH